MFKKLRVKFIAITMTMVAVVMALAFTVVCIVEYQRSYAVVQEALSNAVEEAASRPGNDRRPPAGDENAPPAKPDGDRGALADTGSEMRSARAPAGVPVSMLPDIGLFAPAVAYAAERSESPLWQADASGQQDPMPFGCLDGQAEGQQPDGPGQRFLGQPDGQGQEGQVQPFDPDGNRDPQREPSREQEQGPDERQQESGGQPQGDSGEQSQQREGGGDRQAAADERTGGDLRPPSGGGEYGFDGYPGETADEDAITVDGDSLSDAVPPVIGSRIGTIRQTSSLVPVAVYTVSDTGTLTVVPQVTTASISEDVLLEAAALALDTADGYGTFPDLGLHYYKADKGSTAYLAFADTSYTDNWKSLAVVLLLAGLGTLIAFFVISLFFSKWALRPVREAWDSQRQFVADASHDLKTPLTVILANASILLKHPDHTIASESQWIESTQAEAESMQGLVNEMLELAQIEAGNKVNIAFEPVDFTDLIDGETLLFDSIALERNCEFDCALDADVQVSGSSQQLKKMVSTLVENAFKYVDDSGSVRVSLGASGKDAVLSVRNTGSVIAPEDVPHIFDRFYRTDKARTSGAGGFGLGLAIAREIARAHGGDISCASSAVQGTTFTVTLPLLRSA